eukprot:COSAG01_NODE_12982_length_1653_cov_23.584942_1_plen_242_part_01
MYKCQRDNADADTRDGNRPLQLLVAGTRNGAGNGVGLEEYPPGKVRSRQPTSASNAQLATPRGNSAGGHVRDSLWTSRRHIPGKYPLGLGGNKGTAGAKRFAIVLCLLLTLILAHSALLCGQATGLSARRKDLTYAARTNGAMLSYAKIPPAGNLVETRGRDETNWPVCPTAAAGTAGDNGRSYKAEERQTLMGAASLIGCEWAGDEGIFWPTGFKLGGLPGHHFYPHAIYPGNRRIQIVSA